MLFLLPCSLHFPHYLVFFSRKIAIVDIIILVRYSRVDMYRLFVSGSSVVIANWLIKCDFIVVVVCSFMSQESVNIVFRSHYLFHSEKSSSSLSPFFIVSRLFQHFSSYHYDRLMKNSRIHSPESLNGYCDDREYEKWRDGLFMTVRLSSFVSLAYTSSQHIVTFDEIRKELMVSMRAALLF